jgi:hypothetical protein
MKTLIRNKESRSHPEHSDINRVILFCAVSLTNSFSTILLHGNQAVGFARPALIISVGTTEGKRPLYVPSFGQRNDFRMVPIQAGRAWTV